MDHKTADGGVVLDGKRFNDQSAALDYLLKIWGDFSAEDCRLAETYIGNLEEK